MRHSTRAPWQPRTREMQGKPCSLGINTLGCSTINGSDCGMKEDTMRTHLFLSRTCVCGKVGAASAHCTMDCLSGSNRRCRPSHSQPGNSPMRFRIRWQRPSIATKCGAGAGWQCHRRNQRQQSARRRGECRLRFAHRPDRFDRADGDMGRERRRRGRNPTVPRRRSRGCGRHAAAQIARRTTSWHELTWPRYAVRRLSRASPQAADARRASRLRYVSLPRLEREIARRQAVRKPLDAEMLTLAGLAAGAVRVCLS